MRRSLALFTLLALWPAGPVHAFDVTACYQTVPPHETGILRNDLACDGSGGPNVNVGRGARLELNGHRISGGYIGVSTYPGSGRNVIEGPGEIVGASGDPFGCAIATSSKATIRYLDLHTNRRGIVTVYDYPLKLEHVRISNNTAEGISSYFVNLGSVIGPGNGKITARDVILANNGDNGIEAYGQLQLRDSAVTGSGGSGIVSNGRVFILEDVSITDNTAAGIVSGSPKRGKLKHSVATGNGPEGDIAAPVPPQLITSTCDHSVDTDSGGTLGICVDD